MKKILPLVLALALCSNAAMADGTDSTGSTISKNSDGYYVISSADDLNAFAELVNAAKDTEYNAIVTANIEANASFAPIGDSQDHRYKGTFDGGGYTIKLALNNSTSNYQGLFGCVGYCTIENVTVTGSVTGCNYVGGIVGQIHSDEASMVTTIKKCKNEATITGSYTSGTKNGRTVAGIVGVINCQDSSGKDTYYDDKNENSVSITECTNSGAISGNYYIGGIVGYASVSLTISKCMNIGKISGLKDVGGLVGCFYFSKSGTPKCKLVVEYSANIGTVSSNDSGTTGTLAGPIYVGTFTVKCCYNAAESSSYSTIANKTSVQTITNSYDINSSRFTGFSECTAEQVKNGELCLTLNENNGSTVWYQELDTNPDQYPVLTGDEVYKCTKYSGTDEPVSKFCNSSTISSLSNDDSTIFYLVESSDTSSSAIKTLEGNTTSLNIIYPTDNGNYCNNAVLKYGTPYAIDVDYTAKKFTFDRDLNIGITTFILPATISTSNINGTVYKLSGYKNDQKWPMLTYTEVSGNLEPNKPYLVWNTTTGTKLFNSSSSTLENVSVSAMSPTQVTADGAGATQYGSYTGVSISSYDTTTSYYKETVVSDGTIVAFAKVTDGTTTPTPFSTMISTTDSNNILWVKLGITLTGIESVTAESRLVDVYTISGIKVRSQVVSANALTDLPAGIYIVGSEKVYKN